MVLLHFEKLGIDWKSRVLNRWTDIDTAAANAVSLTVHNTDTFITWPSESAEHDGGDVPAIRPMISYAPI